MEDTTFYTDARANFDSEGGALQPVTPQVTPVTPAKTTLFTTNVIASGVIGVVVGLILTWIF